MCLHQVAFTDHADVDGCGTMLCGQKLCPKFLTIVQQKMCIAETDQLLKNPSPCNARAHNCNHYDTTYLSEGNCKGFHPPWRVVCTERPFRRKIAPAAPAMPSTINTRRTKFIDNPSVWDVAWG
jgi:hypothetical protein